MLGYQLANPWLLLGAPVALLIFTLLLTRTFVKLPLPHEEQRRQRWMRLLLIVTRTLIVALLLLVLAQPYTERTEQVQGDPRITMLVDQSGSMSSLETGFVDGLAGELRDAIPTTRRDFGTELTSEIGNAILQNLEPGGNILLVSDGHATRGAALEDVAYYATTINATINMINLTPASEEWAVTLSGPSKALADSENTYVVTVTSTNLDGEVPLTVTVDGTVGLDRSVAPGRYPFTTPFATGTHQLEARIDVDDGHEESDTFWKTVNVIEKPKVLLVTKKTSPLELLLKQLYDVEKRERLPSDLSPYYAIITNDVPVESLANTQSLHEFLIDEAGEYYGGGLVLFGGLSSFDKGGYSGSQLEQFLPVKVGQGERNKGTTNILFIVDASGGVGGTKYVSEGGRVVEVQQEVPTIDVIKAQVHNAIEQLRIENRVGAIVLGIPSESSGTVEERIADSVKIIERPDYLYNNRKALLEKIPRIKGGGATAADVAFKAAVEQLKGLQGDKVIVLMSDGRYSAGLGAMSPQKERLLTLAENAHRIYGIQFMGIGVGTEKASEFPVKVDETFLKQLAKAGDGTYDRATRLSTLLIKYGDPRAKEYGEEFSLVPLSLTHFITRDVEPAAVLNAFNQVVPKDTAELLITTDAGEPALTTWRYGNGRVATWTVFAGNNLGQLLNEENSILLSRTVNWAIGDPSRKEPYFVTIPDVRSNEEGSVTVQSDSPVASEALDFSKEGDTYTATFEPPNLGFQSILGQTYAVNRPREYDRYGQSPDLRALVSASGGKVFKPSESDAIVEHVKAVSRRVTVERDVQTLPFLVAAIALFLLELLVRRLAERRER